MMEKIIESNKEQDTYDLGYELGQHAKPGQVFTLVGDLGVGKTVFTQGFAAGLGIQEPVNSPTFTIVQEYDDGRLPLYHFDMYRISGWEDLYSTGFFEYAEQGGVIAAEWSENIENALPAGTVTVSFEQTGENERVINIDGARDLDLTETETQ